MLLFRRRKGGGGHGGLNASVVSSAEATMNAQAEVKRLKKQVDRLTFDKAKRTEEEMEKEMKAW